MVMIIAIGNEFPLRGGIQFVCIDRVVGNLGGGDCAVGQLGFAYRPIRQQGARRLPSGAERIALVAGHLAGAVQHELRQADDAAVSGSRRGDSLHVRYFLDTGIARHAGGGSGIALLLVIGDGDSDGRSRRTADADDARVEQHQLPPLAVDGHAGLDGDFLIPGLLDRQAPGHPVSVQGLVMAAAHRQMVLLLIRKIRLYQKLVIEIMQTLDISHGFPCLSSY